jgi:hypothetical protein
MGDPEIRDWLVMMPQLESEGPCGTKRCGLLSLRVQQRSRIQLAGMRYKVFSEPDHARVAEYVAGNCDVRDPSRAAKELREPGRAVLGAYACLDRARETTVSLGFFLEIPRNHIVEGLKFVTSGAGQ